jgi:hypothetical protein
MGDWLINTTTLAHTLLCPGFESSRFYRNLQAGLKTRYASVAVIDGVLTPHLNAMSG